MNTPEVVSGDDEQFARLLARYSEALNAGRDADPAADPNLSAQMRRRLQRALSSLRRLRQSQTPAPRAESPTQVMAKDKTLVDARIGTQVGRFRILRTLGRGGGGIVFLAFDPDLRREVALKVPHLPGLIEPDMRRRFLREARAAARLDHPNLVPVHEVGEANGVCFIVSAYCRGGSLAQWLAVRTTPVPVRQAAELIAELADAVYYVHEHGIYHRDLKPGNILLDPREEHSTSSQREQGMMPFTPRLTDFGLAKQMDSDSSLASNSVVAGTPSYMAPEQFECRPGNIGPGTDVYGLGAVFYELLTGQPPFKGASDSETMDQVLFQEPAPPRRLRSDVPRDLDAICLKCLDKSPQQRYASAADLADDLHRFLGNKSSRKRRPKAVGQLSKWMRRHPRMKVLGYAALFAVLSLLVGTLLLQAMR